MKKMKIGLYPMKKGFFTLEVDCKDSVAELKKQIEMIKGADYLAEHQTLIFHGNILDEDEATLADCGIYEDACLLILLAKIDIQCPVTGNTIHKRKFTEYNDEWRESRYLSDFAEIKKLGSGADGSVYKVISLVDGADYAVKKIPLTQPFEKTRREIIALANMDHPNILRYFQGWIEPHITGDLDDHTSGSDETEATSVESSEPLAEAPPVLYILTECCKSTLFDDLKGGLYKDERILAYDTFKQLTQALQYIHGKGYVHRDLSSMNVFTDGKGKVKIGDFGMVKLNITEEHLARSTATDGNSLYRAPETHKDVVVTPKVDIFSLGVILAEMLCGLDEASATGSERIYLLMSLQKGTDLLKEYHLKPSDLRFLKLLLHIDPTIRPSAMDILAIHRPWEFLHLDDVLLLG